MLAALPGRPIFGLINPNEFIATSMAVISPLLKLLAKAFARNEAQFQFVPKKKLDIAGHEAPVASCIWFAKNADSGRLVRSVPGVRTSFAMPLKAPVKPCPDAMSLKSTSCAPSD